MVLSSSILLALTASQLVSAIPVKPRDACHDYLLINVRGTLEPLNDFFATRPMIEKIMQTRSNGAVYETQYPANADQSGTEIGVDDITRVIQTGLQNCPSQEYVIIGYSQGATVADRLLMKFSPDSPEGKAIRAVVVMGNPYHLPFKRGNVDENGGIGTSWALGSFTPTNPFAIPDAWYNSGKVTDICYTDDKICNLVNLMKLNVLALNLDQLLKLNIPGIFGTNHLMYPTTSSLQDFATNFVLGFLGK